MEDKIPTQLTMESFMETTWRLIILIPIQAQISPMMKKLFIMH